MSKSRPVYWMWWAEPLSLPLFSPTEIIPLWFSRRGSPATVSPHPGRWQVPFAKVRRAASRATRHRSQWTRAAEAMGNLVAHPPVAACGWTPLLTTISKPGARAAPQDGEKTAPCRGSGWLRSRWPRGHERRWLGGTPGQGESGWALFCPRVSRASLLID